MAVEGRIPWHGFRSVTLKRCDLSWYHATQTL